MSKNRNLLQNSKGFSALDITLVAALIIVIGVAGWYAVGNKNQAKSNDTSPPAEKSPSTQPTASPAAQVNNPLVVSEWGVKIPLADKTSDAYYVVSNSTKDANGQPNTVWLGLKSLDATGCAASNANNGKGTAIAALLRVAPNDTDPISGQTYKEKYPNGTTIGNYYYAYQSQTSGKTCTSEENLQQINAAFTTASKSVTAN
jgi:hypothetical protein